MNQFEGPRRAVSVALFQDTGAGRTLSRLLLEHDIEPSTDHRKADVIVADLTSHQEKDIGSAIAHYRDLSLGKPLLFLVSTAQLDQPQMVDLAQTETMVVSAAGERGLITEIARRAHDTDRADEAAVRLRAVSAAGLGALPAHPASPEASALLVATPTPRSLDLSSELSVYTTLNTVMSRQQALSALELGVADRVFILPEQNRRPMAAMIKLIRRHSELSGVPVVVIEENPRDRHRDYWSRVGADAVVSAAQARTAAAIAAQRARAREAQQSATRLLRHLSFTDHGEQSRLSSPRFFEAALALRCHSGQPFCLGAMRLTPHEGESSAQIFTEPAIYVALGCQPADLVTRAAPDLLLVSMAGTDLHYGKRTLQMLSTLVQDLKFGTQTAPMTFGTTTNVVAATKGASARGLIRAAIQGLNNPVPTDALFA